MPEDSLPHVLAIAVLLSRLADVGSTYLISPNLELEANGFLRRFRWPFAFMTLGLCFLPYLHPGLGIIVLVGSLLVSASNIRQAWIARALGETEYLALLRSAAARSGRRAVFASILTSSLLVGLAGLVLLFLYPTPGWAWYFAFGVLSYALAIALHGSRFATRLFDSSGE